MGHNTYCHGMATYGKVTEKDRLMPLDYNVYAP